LFTYERVKIIEGASVVCDGTHGLHSATPKKI
jgi:hypothetical protein